MYDFFSFNINTVIICIGFYIVVYNQNKMAKVYDDHRQEDQ